MSKPESFSDQIRRAVLECGMTQAELSRATDGYVSQTRLSQFMNAGEGMNFARLDRLAEVLGLHVVRRIVE